MPVSTLKERVLWDLIKRGIRQVSITYSKNKHKLRNKNTFEQLIVELQQAEETCDQNPTDENIQKRESLKLRFESHNECIVKGAITRSWVNWYEQVRKINIF